MEDRTSEPGPKSSIPTSAMTSVRIPTLVLLAIAVVLVDHAEANCANSLDQRMARYKDGFAKCLGQKTVCFFFTQEAPFTRFPKGYPDDMSDSVGDINEPFPCKDFEAKGFSGLAFKMLVLMGAKQEMCILVDSKDCSFNGLVDYLGNANKNGHPAHTSVFGILGALFFTPRRIPLADFSLPMFRERMVVVRQKDGEKAGGVTRRVWPAFVESASPLERDAWFLLFGFMVFYLVVIWIVSIFRPFPVFVSGRSTSKKFSVWLLNTIWNVVGGPVGTSEGQLMFEPARRVLNYIPVGIIAITIVFYEAGLVLGNISTFETSITRSNDELCSWTVVRGSALEEALAAAVNNDRKDGDTIDIDSLQSESTERPWTTCRSFDECFDQLGRKTADIREESPFDNNTNCRGSDTTVKFVVAFESIVNDKFNSNPSLCNSLEVVSTREPLEKFLSGLLYSKVESGSPGRKILDSHLNGTLVTLREPDTAKLYAKELNAPASCSVSRRKVSISNFLFPLILAVGFPLISALVLMFVYPALINHAVIDITDITG